MAKQNTPSMKLLGTSSWREGAPIVVSVAMITVNAFLIGHNHYKHAGFYIISIVGLLFGLISLLYAIKILILVVRRGYLDYMINVMEQYVIEYDKLVDDIEKDIAKTKKSKKVKQ